MRKNKKKHKRITKIEKHKIGEKKRRIEWKKEWEKYGFGKEEERSGKRTTERIVE